MRTASILDFAPALNEAARHPMRRAMPAPMAEPADLMSSDTAENVRLFLLAYCAAFMAFMLFIS